MPKLSYERFWCINIILMQNSKSNITDLRPSKWLIIDTNFVLGLCCVIVDDVADISEVQIASNFWSKCVG